MQQVTKEQATGIRCPVGGDRDLLFFIVYISVVAWFVAWLMVTVIVHMCKLLPGENARARVSRYSRIGNSKILKQYRLPSPLLRMGKFDRMLITLLPLSNRYNRSIVAQGLPSDGAMPL